MRFSVVAATAILATAVSAADYGYAAPVSTSEYIEHVTITVDCSAKPGECTHGGYEPTSTSSSVKIQPTGVYGNGTHPVYTPTYPIPSKGAHGGKDDEDKDKYDYTTITSTYCEPKTTVIVSKIPKPTPSTYKPTGAPVSPTGPKGPEFTGAASSLQMGSFAAIAGVAAFILA